MRPIPAVVGPTASGKTAVAIALAERINGEIISCDSMQIYRDMDIGTAKPTAAEQAAVPHHLIDFLEPEMPYSAAIYAQDAAAAVAEIEARGKTPIFCGGTGLYLAAAARGNGLPEVPGETPHRAVLEQRAAEEGGAAALYAELMAVDPASAAATHPHNRRRVIRALEIFYETGVPKSEWDRRTREAEPALPICAFMPDYPDRALLYRRIDDRVDAMLAAGLLEEVRALYARGLLSPTLTAGQAIGYKELAAFLRGEVDYETAVADLKTATRRYAKRQLTWFRADPHLVSLCATLPNGDPKTPQALANEIVERLAMI